MRFVYRFPSGINFLLLPRDSVVCVYRSNILESFKLPIRYYTNVAFNYSSIIFYAKVAYKFMFYNIRRLCNNLTYIRSIRLRIRGLGYTVNHATLDLCAFCFNWINYIYLYLPIFLLLKVYKKRFIILSKNWHILNIVLKQLLALKRVGPYELRGFKLPRRLILTKKSGKKS